MQNYMDRLEIVAGKRSGKPCIKNTRITIYDILNYLAAGTSYDELLNDFPQLIKDDIYASLQFAANLNGRISYGNSSEIPAG